MVINLMILIVIIVGIIFFIIGLKNMTNGMSDYEIWKEQDKANYPELYEDENEE